MKTNKIFGLILLIIGVAIIIYGLYSSFKIFTAKETAPEIFKTQAQTITEKPEGVEQEMGKAVGEQLQKMLPTDSVPRLLNLISWSLWAAILIFSRTQIAGLGIKLLK